MKVIIFCGNKNVIATYQHWDILKLVDLDSFPLQLPILLTLTIITTDDNYYFMLTPPADNSLVSNLELRY